MSKYELSLARDYVPDWTYLEAVRELFQNAIDAGNYNCSYDEQAQTLSISNKGAQLETSSLLLGRSTKKDDTSKIGQFGEGYKIALLVLTREGKRVKIYNGKSREVWLARFVNSRRYGAEVLTIFTEKLSLWEKAEDAVTFEIEGILADEYEEIVKHNLHLNDDIGEVHHTTRGEILLDPEYEGQVFVSGLYVCEDTSLKYGYNMRPQYIRLDRDRMTVRDFDIKWEASAMWAQIGGEECTRLCFEGADDVAYIQSQYISNLVRENLLSSFIAKYGTSAVPCRTQDELDEASNLYVACKPVVVSNVVYGMIHDKVVSGLTKVESELTLRERFEQWYSDHVYAMSAEGLGAWEALLDELN